MAKPRLQYRQYRDGPRSPDRCSSLPYRRAESISLQLQGKSQQAAFRTRRANIKADAINDASVQRLRKVFSGPSPIERVFFPERRSGSRPCRSDARCCVPEQSLDEETKTKAWTRHRARSAHPSGVKSALIFAVPQKPCIKKTLCYYSHGKKLDRVAGDKYR